MKKKKMNTKAIGTIIPILLSIFFVGCVPKKIDISGLSELPPNLAINLGPDFTVQGFKSFPIDFDHIKTNPDFIKPQDDVEKAYTRTYTFPVIYFKTHCKSAIEINFPEGVQVLKMPEMPVSSDDRDSLLKTPKLSYYKLTTFQGEKLVGPQVCQVHHIHWYVTITQDTYCDLTTLHRYKFEFDYPGDQVFFIWHANSLDEIPIPTNMIKVDDLKFMGESFTCCGATKLCEGNCIPQTFDCGTSI